MSRPIVFDYEDPVRFLRDLGDHHRQTRRGFSVRSRVRCADGCSPALITQVLKGRRKLKRDQLLNFARIFLLTATEVNHLEALLKSEQVGHLRQTPDFAKSKPAAKVAKNHLLADWLHPYVKDLVELQDFKLEPKWILQRLGGVATLDRIDKSVRFLLREGFWRRDACGKIIPEEDAVITTCEIPNGKIKSFHKQALKIAAKGLDEFPVHRRKASTIIVAVNAETKNELNALINKFQSDLTRFIECHPPLKDELVQIAIHMTPVGGRNA